MERKRRARLDLFRQASKSHDRGSVRRLPFDAQSFQLLVKVASFQTELSSRPGHAPAIPLEHLKDEVPLEPVQLGGQIALFERNGRPGTAATSNVPEIAFATSPSRRRVAALSWL